MEWLEVMGVAKFRNVDSSGGVEASAGSMFKKSESLGIMGSPRLESAAALRDATDDTVTRG